MGLRKAQLLVLRGWEEECSYRGPPEGGIVRSVVPILQFLGAAQSAAPEFQFPEFAQLQCRGVCATQTKGAERNR